MAAAGPDRVGERWKSCVYLIVFVTYSVTWAAPGGNRCKVSIQSTSSVSKYYARGVYMAGMDDNKGQQ